jgi:hypothetical protein
LQNDFDVDAEKSEDSEYKPIDPSQIKLLQPQPPSEKIMKAVEAFYSPSTIDNPRNEYATGFSYNFALKNFLFGSNHAW